MPLRIRSVTTGDGSSTITVWKRRARALSFSIFLRYSSSVVAPINFKLLRARAGFRMFAASMLPSAEPAPESKCNSSINRITSSSPTASSITPLIRSSNSPRNLVPATTELRSICQICLPTSLSGTSFLATRIARPSTMAVFPTPASPIKTGLLLLRRQSTVMARSISCSRPITVSSLPALASSVKSVPYFDKKR